MVLCIVHLEDWSQYTLNICDYFVFKFLSFINWFIYIQYLFIYLDVFASEALKFKFKLYWYHCTVFHHIVKPLALFCSRFPSFFFFRLCYKPGLTELPKTFVLELIESLLAQYSALFYNVSEPDPIMHALICVFLGFNMHICMALMRCV